MVSINVDRLLLALVFVLGLFLVVTLVDDEDTYVNTEEQLHALLLEPGKMRSNFHWASTNGTCGGVANCTSCVNGTCLDPTGYVTDATYGGDQTFTGDMTYSGVITYDAPGTTTSNFAMVFLSGSQLIINGARVFAGSGSITFASGSVVIVNALLTFRTTAAVIFGAVTVNLGAGVIFASLSLSMSGSTLAFRNNATAQFQSVNNTLTACALSGDGLGYVNAAGAYLASTGDNWSIPLLLTLVTPSTGAARRTSFDSTSSANWCGSTYSTTTVASNTAIIVDTSCTLASNTTYSSLTTSVAWSSGSFVQFDSISSSSKPLYADSLTMDTTTVEAINTGSGAYTVNLAEYNKSGTCITNFATTSIDGCPSGYTCTITGSQDSSNPNQCNIVYTQVVSSSNDDDDGSNSSYYALFALLVIPIALVIALVALKCCRTKQEATMVHLEYTAPTSGDASKLTPSPPDVSREH